MKVSTTEIEPATPRPVAQRSNVEAPIPGRIMLARSCSELCSASSSRSSVAAPSDVPQGRKPLILLITGGMGGGHTSPMEAVHERLRFDDRVEVRKAADVRVAPFGRNRIDDIRYNISDNRLGAKLATKWREKFSQKWTYLTVKTLIDIHKPDYVFVNHRILAQAAAKYLPRDKPIALATADHGRMHVGWYPARFNAKHTRDVLLVPNQRGVLHAHGYVPQHRIRVAGYPVRAPFEQFRNSDKAALRQELGLPENRKIVVMSGGGGKWGDYFVKLAKALASDDRASDIHLIAVAGRNEELRAELQTQLDSIRDKNREVSFQVEGFCESESMARFMRASDVNAIKAGGASLGESYALGTVPLIYQALSGVEPHNVDHVKRHGTGMVALTQKEFVDKVFETNEEALQAMRRNQEAFPTVGAAANIARFLRMHALNPNMDFRHLDAQPA